MFDRALRHDLRHDLIGVIDALADDRASPQQSSMVRKRERRTAVRKV
jgi:hypothetical protein